MFSSGFHRVISCFEGGQAAGFHGRVVYGLQWLHLDPLHAASVTSHLLGAQNQRNPQRNPCKNH